LNRCVRELKMEESLEIFIHFLCTHVQLLTGTKDNENPVLDPHLLASEEMLEYLAGVVKEADLSEFLKLLSGFCPDFDPTMIENDADVQNMFQDMKCNKLLFNSEKDEKSEIEEGEQLKIKELNRQDASSCVVSPKQTALHQVPENKLNQVLEVCPQDCNKDAIRHLLERKCIWNVHLAVQHIIDDSLEKITAEYEEYLEEEERKRAENVASEREMKKSLMKKFDEVVVQGERRIIDAKRFRREQKKAQKLEEQQKTENLVRFLDGKVVSRSGEKFTVVSEPKEWDGGSRGRVKTKGKRGPGYLPA